MYCYLVGDIMTKGSQYEASLIEDMLKQAGIEFYSARLNKDINDKANCDNERLAERITEQDFQRLEQADLVVYNVNQSAIGSLVEVGYLLKRKRLHPELKFIAVCSDIRRTNVPEVGDRRSFSVNALLYGVLLELTEGAGIITFEELPAALNELK